MLAEIETDKATMELEAVDEGILGKIMVGEGSAAVAVNTPIAVILAEGEEVQQRRELLKDAMGGLNDRERFILTERRLKDEPATLEELSQRYDISRERVRQIEVRAFEKLQKAMRADAKARHYEEASA